VFEQIIAFKNLLSAYYRARRSKRFRSKLQKIELNFEDRLIKIRKQLKNGTYRPKPYHKFLVHEPKLRNISAPALIDRIVHHAIIHIIESVFEPQFISHTFACRKNKGALCARHHLEKSYKKCFKKYQIFYALKCDVKSFFASVDHQILIKLVSKSIVCPKTLKLLIIIINSYQDMPDKGIPIGNLTSQLFANAYLHPLDILITKEFKEKNYFRYMDDFIILSADKNYLIEIRNQISLFLEIELKLQLHQHKTNIFRADKGLDFVGFMIKPTGITIRKKTLRRYKKRHKKRLKQLKNYKNNLKKYQFNQLSLFENHQNNIYKTEKNIEKIKNFKIKLRASRNSFKGLLKHSKYKRLKSGGVEVNGIIIPNIFPRKKITKQLYT